MPPRYRQNVKSKTKNNTEKPRRVTRSVSASSDTQISVLESFKMAAKSDEAGGGNMKETRKTEETQFETIIKQLKEMDETNKIRLETLSNTFDKKLTAIKEEFMKAFSEVKKEVDKTKEEVKVLSAKVVDLEKSNTFTSDKVDDLEKQIDSRVEAKTKKIEAEHEAKEKLLKEKIKALEEKMVLTEKHNRKCNLLFYGILDPPLDKTSGKPVENTQETLREFFKTELKLSESFIEGVRFGNVHRLNPRPKGPTPIIARFLSYEDREIVFRAAKNLGPGKRVLSDLPVVMKEERHRLAKIAYDFRHKSGPDKRQTRILEDGVRVVLQVRKTHLDKWEEIKV